MSGKKLLMLLTLLVSFLSLASLQAEPVDINSADAQTLAESLNGIGIVKAQAIVDFRSTNGNFKSVQDLGLVKGIGQRTVVRNQNDLALNSQDLAKKRKMQKNKNSTSEKPMAEKSMVENLKTVDKKK